MWCFNKSIIVLKKICIKNNKKEVILLEIVLKVFVLK